MYSWTKWDILTPGGRLPPPGTGFIMEYILSPEFVESNEIVNKEKAEV